MGHALREAEEAFTIGEIPVGAVVVFEGRIVGRGHNQVEMLKDPTAHAEMIALTAACATLDNKFLVECTLYVTLEPCPMCAGASVWTRVKRIVYGAADPKAGACGSLFNIGSNNKLNHRAEIIQGVREAECEAILKRFFRGKRE
ncbi:MAG: nucleoside deaminase [Balneolaceae bacterium]|nr:MAG: nucleoside deaminase [Balneolaceae bacterium]